jgi:hypothetical protein
LEKEIHSFDEIKIQSWLFKKSKQIEPDAISKYPRLRKFPLKSPSPKHLKSYQPDGPSTPSSSRQHLNFSYSSLNRQATSSSHISGAQNSPSLIKTKKEPDTKQSPFLVSLDSPRENSQSNKLQRKRNKMHEINPQDKLSISSTDSSAPSSPPPNYEDIIYLNNHTAPVNIDNCFDNPTYFQELPLLSSSFKIINRNIDESNDAAHHNFKRYSVNYTTGSSLLIHPPSTEELNSSFQFDQGNLFFPKDLKFSGYTFNEQTSGSISPFIKHSSRVTSMSLPCTPPPVPAPQIFHRYFEHSSIAKRIFKHNRYIK